MILDNCWLQIRASRPFINDYGKVTAVDLGKILREWLKQTKEVTSKYKRLDELLDDICDPQRNCKQLFCTYISILNVDAFYGIAQTITIQLQFQHNQLQFLHIQLQFLHIQKQKKQLQSLFLGIKTHTRSAKIMPRRNSKRTKQAALSRHLHRHRHRYALLLLVTGSLDRLVSHSTVNQQRPKDFY